MSVTIDRGRAAVDFDRFDLEAYELFLRCKQLPESELICDRLTDTYRVTTPARYAPLLGAGVAATIDESMAIAGHLFDYQRWIAEQALDARRFAVWIDTGLGKTAILLEWARQVDGPVLILCPLQVVRQTVEEADRFYADRLALEVLDTRKDLDAWLTAPVGVAITNTEKITAGDEPPKLRGLTGLVLDESSILKTGGGKTKWALIHGSRGVPYKLSLTATPAPNDTMEYASQAAFLERLRTEGEILWTWFSRDKRGTWQVKPHGREAFYRFMASWSVYMRDPAAYGFEPILDSLPPAVTHEHTIAITAAQRSAADGLMVEQGRGLFDERLGVRERAKLAQLARGFLYRKGGAAERVGSDKPEKVAELVVAERAAGRPTLIWTTFDEEAAILAELLPDAEALHGATPVGERTAIIDRFRHGGCDTLITKAQLVGHGLNFQRCQAMVFSGLDDSFERFYQAVRRAYRFGQTEAVQVHLPVIPELEGFMVENVKQKEQRFLADVARQEADYRRALEDLL